MSFAKYFRLPVRVGPENPEGLEAVVRQPPETLIHGCADKLSVFNGDEEVARAEVDPHIAIKGVLRWPSDGLKRGQQ